MSKFAHAMNASARTWNGATSLASPDPTGEVSGRMSLFFKSTLGLDIPTLYGYVRESARENLVDTFVMAFHIRDCRKGKGMRELGRQSLIWLFLNYPAEFKKVMKLIPEYGRWDDFLQFFPSVRDTNDPEIDNPETLKRLQNDIVEHYGNQLKTDLVNMNSGSVCSLAAKWAPTQKDSLDRKHNIFKTLADAMHEHPKYLRKKYLTPLRAYLKVVEQYMCSGNWDKIDYSKVPSQAMKRLRKAFQKHDSQRFLEWRANLVNPDEEKKTKVNAKTLHPHEIVREFRRTERSDPVLEAQWAVLEEEVKKLGTLEDCVMVCDTSGSMSSMNCLPLDICVALGMIVSSSVQGEFHNQVITFNRTPEFIKIKDGSAFDRWKQIQGIPWGGNTNLRATFRLILNRGRQCQLTNEDMPKRLIIVSDMQFDSVEGYYGGSKTNFEEIDEMYRESGYTRPQIVFWNVNGSSRDYPITAGENGTALVSGSSPSTLEAIIKTRDFTPNGIMRSTLDQERYDAVRNALSN